MARGTQPNQAGPPTNGRVPLTRARVLEAALAYADTHGGESLSMRRLGTELGVEGMSLYKHVSDKDALLDGMVELLWAELSTSPPPDAEWSDALRALAYAIRDVFHRHPNTAPLIAARNFVNAHVLRCYDGHVRLLERAGFERRAAIQAISTVIGHGLGHALLELRWADAHPDSGDEVSEVGRIRRVTQTLPVDLPDALVELAVELTDDYDRDRYFELSTAALLQGLGAAAPTARHTKEVNREGSGSASPRSRHSGRGR